MGNRILQNSRYLIWGAFFVFLGVIAIAYPAGRGGGIVLLLLGGWNIIASIAEIRGVSHRQIVQLNVLKGIALLIVGLLLLTGAMGSDTILTLAGIAGLLYGGWSLYSSISQLNTMGAGKT